MSSLLWLRDFCYERAAWHKKKSFQWANSLNIEFKERHNALAKMEQKQYKQWNDAAKELDKVLSAKLKGK